MAVPDPRALRMTLDGCARLTPWLDAVDAIFPKIAREKPRKLLEKLANMVQIAGKSVEQLLNTAVFCADMPSFLDAMLLGEEADVRRASGTGSASGAVRLMTLHAAKGLEFPVVFLAGVNAGTLPLERREDPADPLEERRLFFVGITRAREELIISCGGEPSAFLEELPGHVARQTVRGYAPPCEQMRLF